jgi:hypothetical protein
MMIMQCWLIGALLNLFDPTSFHHDEALFVTVCCACDEGVFGTESNCAVVRHQAELRALRIRLAGHDRNTRSCGKLK